MVSGPEPPRPPWPVGRSRLSRVGAVAFARPGSALMPGLGFWDTGEYQTVGPLLGTAHPTGFPT